MWERGLKNPSDGLKILVLTSEVLIFLGVFFIMSMTLGRTVQVMYIGLIFSLLAPVLLILTRVMMLKKSARTESERKTDIEALCEHLRQIGLDVTVESKQQEISSFREKISVAFLLYMFIFMPLWVGFVVLLIIPVDMLWMLVGVGITQ